LPYAHGVAIIHIEFVAAIRVVITIIFIIIVTVIAIIMFVFFIFSNVIFAAAARAE
jgi:hypothetical protein